MTKSPLRVICDAGPIIHLDELDCLDLLNDFKEIILPATVTKEIKRNRKSALENIRRTFIELPGNKPRNEQLLTMCQVFSKPVDVLKILSDIPNKSTLYLKTSLLEDAKMRIRKEFGL